MANSGEPLLSRRKSRQAKEAERLEPKGKWRGRGAAVTLLADVEPLAERRSLTPLGMVLVWNVGQAPSSPQWMWKVTREGALVDEGYGMPEEAKAGW